MKCLEIKTNEKLLLRTQLAMEDGKQLPILMAFLGGGGCLTAKLMGEKSRPPIAERDVREWLLVAIIM